MVKLPSDWKSELCLSQLYVPPHITFLCLSFINCKMGMVTFSSGYPIGLLGSLRRIMHIKYLTVADTWKALGVCIQISY